MIGEKIRFLRRQRNLSLSELSIQSDVAKSYLSAIERNIQVNPSIQVIEKLASVLEVSVQEIISSDEHQSDEILDPEWIELAKEAMNSGVSKEDFISFLEFQKWRLKNEG